MYILLYDTTIYDDMQSDATHHAIAYLEIEIFFRIDSDGFRLPWDRFRNESE